MKSFTTLSSLFTTYVQNTSTAVTALGKQLINDTHRYLLQKYFNNETSYSIPTFGGNAYNLTTTVAISAGATSATLSAPFSGATGSYTVVFSDASTQVATLTKSSTAITWSTGLTNAVSTSIGVTYVLTAAVSQGATSATLGAVWVGNTVPIQVTFSDGEVYYVQFTNNSAAITWQVPLQATVTRVISMGGQQFYAVPPNYSKMKSVTLTTGNLQWPLEEILTRKEWDKLNMFPYYASIPLYYFIFPGGDHGVQVGIWPIPSSSTNVINYNYKYRVPDLNIDDATVSITVNNGSQQVTSSGLAVTTNPQLEARWISVAQTSGDSLWYEIVNIPDTAHATLYAPYLGVSLTSSTTATIGQMPIINEDFHDLLVYRPLWLYFSTIQKDMEKANQFRALYEDGERRLNIYCGGNVTDVNLGRRPINQNPNLYQQSVGGLPS